MLTPQGPVSIEKLSAGAPIYSWDTGKNELVPARVGLLRKRTSDGLLKITFSNGSVLQTTLEHPFYDPGTDTYKPIENFKAGDSVFFVENPQKKGVTLQIQSIEKVPGSATVYTISVDGKFQNFFADGVLVHNKCPSNPCT